MALPESNGKIVLISGVNGYIASRTALRFLEGGYSIRGTSRRAESARPLVEQALKEYNDAGRIEIVEVPDITVEGAFDEAVKGVHAVAHMASPVSLSFTDPAPVLHAAITGTLTILNSALKAGPQLKHFVLISSVAAIYHPPPTPTYTFTESDWNDFSPAEVRRLGTSSPGNQIYNASKSESERALWKWVAEHKPTFTVAAVNPAFVYGPPLQLPESPERLNETIVPIWKNFSGEAGSEPVGLGGSGGYVDVRDVADLMLYCVAHGDEANGQRYLAVGGAGPAQATVDALRAAYPERRDIIPKGKPGVGYSKDYAFPQGGIKFDSSKGRKAIGHAWIPYDKTVVDTARVFEKWL